MKIHFDNVFFSGTGAKTGPNTFGRRLAEGLVNQGHTITEASDEYDVMLSFIQQTKENRLGSKLVQRLDGIWFKPDNFDINNKKIRECYSKADLVIWQSEFDKCMTTKWWGSPSKGTVIHNGIQLNPVTKLTIPYVERIRASYDQVFICSSNWHPQKRLKQNIELFDHLRKNWYPNSCLIVMGMNPDCIVSDPSVFYTGSVPQEVYMQLYSIANWMIHLAWLDHCPNVVIEALSQGTPVICSEAGGTKELVQDFGIVLQERAPYGFELADYDNPPHIDVTQIDSVLVKPEPGTHADIDINNTCARYEQALRGIL